MADHTKTVKKLYAALDALLRESLPADGKPRTKIEKRAAEVLEETREEFRRDR